MMDKMEKEMPAEKRGKEEDLEKEEEALFWADQLAKKIVERQKFDYIDKAIPKFKEFTVKTSASISGVLHIGRLSDTIRGDSVYRALKDLGVKAKFIWVAEDMDPLRKVPQGVPADYEKYIGMPITSIPDPEGCHKTYAEHHVSEYMKVLKKFIHDKMKVYSMQQEYDRRKFRKYIKKAMQKIEVIKEIQNKYRANPLPKGWSPWVPVCTNCGKISTTKVIDVKDGLVHYECSNYYFEKTTAKGCGYKGVADPLKDRGKLMWKTEWAAQWARWKICSEGAGKEYQVPASAFWINGEIAEKVFSFPMPVPIFYEHLMIDGAKMSASLGNVVYPKDWLNVAEPELLRFYYNKRLMKTRSFSWKDLPQLYDEFDETARIYFGETKLENEKEEKHFKRLYEISAIKPEPPLGMSFAHATIIAQIFEGKKGMISSLEKTGHYKKELKKRLLQRIEKAKYWIEHYAPQEARFVLQQEISPSINLSEKQKQAIRMVVKALKEEKKKWNEKTLFEEFYSICRELQLEPREFFKAGYLVLLNMERGPKLAPFVLALGDRALKLLEQV